MKQKQQIYALWIILFILFSGCSTHIKKNKPKDRIIAVPLHVITELPEETNISNEPVIAEDKPIELTQPIVVKPIVKKETPKKVINILPKKESENDVITTENLSIKELNQKAKENKTREVRDMLEKNPKAIGLISESNNKLLYLGPSGWRVIDIVEGFRNRRLKEKYVVDHIISSKHPYKFFTYDEIQILIKHKVPFKVINAMMNVSK